MQTTRSVKTVFQVFEGSTGSHHKDPARHEEVGRVRKPHFVLPRGRRLSPLQRGQMRESGRSVKIHVYWLAKQIPMKLVAEEG